MHGIIRHTKKEGLVAGKLRGIEPVQAENSGDEDDNIHFP